MAQMLTLPPELHGPAPAAPKLPGLGRDTTPGPQQARPLPKPAPRAELKARHGWLGVSFATLVLLPGAILAFYLYVIASPQYASVTAFPSKKMGPRQVWIC